MRKFCYALPIIFLFLSGCLARDKPAANLKFSSFHQFDDRYSIVFYSDRDIDALFFPDKGEKTVVRSLICALGDDQDFRVEHNLEKLFDGSLSLEKREDENLYRYSSHGDFFLSWDGDARRRTMESREILKLIENKGEVDCKVVITVYLHRPYYSNSMKIPVAALAGVLKKAPRPQSCCKVRDALRGK